MDGLGAGVRLHVFVLQMLHGDMRVDLRRGKRGMAEHLLHGAEVGAAFDEVRAEVLRLSEERQDKNRRKAQTEEP